MLAGYDTLLKYAESPDHIVPGHDPLVRARYPALDVAGVKSSLAPLGRKAGVAGRSHPPTCPAFMAYSSAISTALRELVDGEPSRVHRNG